MNKYKLVEVQEDVETRKRCCCNCGHNIRGKLNEDSTCEIDGHKIGYIQCFEGWCRRWCKDRKWEEE